ncbi:MAG: aldo/keto reductase [Halobacteriales archaeon]
MTFGEQHRLGLGTWKNTDPAECRDAVREALQLGYRHIDTAQLYENEASVGEGIAAADVDREDVFLATKVGTGNLAHDDVLASTEESLAKLGTDYVDLLYVHWPIRTYDAEATLTAFQKLYEEGLIRHVGVSNFEERHLAEAAEVLDAPIFANQVECNPYLQQEKLRAHARDHDYWLVAYSPLARGAVFDDPVLTDVAEKHDATVPQVALAWLLSLENVVAIPKARGEHVAENWAARNIDLDTDDMGRIANLDRGERQVDFGAAPWNAA